MAKKPTKPKKDAHKSPAMVRLSAEAVAILDAIKSHTLRPKTTEVLVALRAHAKSLGVHVPGYFS